MSLESILTPIYYSADAGLLSANKFYNYLKDNEILYNGKKITLRQITEFINKQATQQSFSYQPQQRRLQYPIRAAFAFQKIQIDLMDTRNENMKANVRKVNNKNEATEYLFCGIDIFSRYAFVYPMQNKEGPECTRCLKLMLEEIYVLQGGISLMPDNLTLISDNESGFMSGQFQKECEDNAITQEFVKHDYKRKSVVERFIRTMRQLIRKYEFGFQSTRYIDQLNDLVYKYNNTIHSSTRTTPMKAFDDNTKYEKLVQSRIDKIDCYRNPSSKCNEKYGFSYYKYNPPPSLRSDKFTKFQVGDRVRLAVKKPLTAEDPEERKRFEKRKWSKEDFTFTKNIHAIQEIIGYKYKVSGRADLYRRSELQLVSGEPQTIPREIEEKYKQRPNNVEPDYENKYSDDNNAFDPTASRNRSNDLRLLQNQIEQTDEEYQSNLNNNPQRRSQRGLTSNRTIYVEAVDRYMTPLEYAQYENARANGHRGSGIKTKKMTLKQLRSLFNPY
jgi:hypothetical protein